MSVGVGGVVGVAVVVGVGVGVGVVVAVGVGVGLDKEGAMGVFETMGFFFTILATGLFTAFALIAGLVGAVVMYACIVRGIEAFSEDIKDGKDVRRVMKPGSFRQAVKEMVGS